MASSALSAGQIEQARGFGTATLHEAAGRVGALPSNIKAVIAGFATVRPSLYRAWSRL